MRAVGEIVRERPLFRISKDMSALQVAQYMTEKKIGAVCVCDGDRLVGVVSERDLMSKVIARKMSPKATLVQDIMAREVVIAESGENIETCVERMQKAGIRHLPVIENQKLIGMISIRDLLMQEVDQKDFEVKMMTTYIYSHPAVTGE